MHDLLIVGGGIVGLAAARELLQRHPGLSLALLEKEPELAVHQTGHNSGVLHSGIYYTPGSLKARLCVAGHTAMLRYCDEKGIPYRLIGKLIVALDESERPRLQALYERGLQNGVRGLELLDGDGLRVHEPHCAGVAAIWSPSTGIVDYRQVALAYADDIQAAGGQLLTGHTVTHIENRGALTVVHTSQGELQARTVITCAGLYSDRISGAHKALRIVPFRGSYYTLSERAAPWVNGLIYPVPDPRFPFLGVHFTPTMHGEVWVGPNAVLAFAREGYRRADLNLRDLFDTLTFRGFWRLAGRYWRTGTAEIYRDFVKAAYLRTAQAYLPDLTAADLLPGPAGVRAQALTIDGTLADDFLIKQAGRTIHVQNAPSPAATSSLMIGQHIAAAAAPLLADH